VSYCIITVVTSASYATVKKNVFLVKKTAAIGTGIFAISIFFHRVYKLSILH